MKIAILGWGSLVKEPRDLPIVGEWQPDGPNLWIEFSRISRKGERAGCLTLVIDEHCGSEVTTLHVLSKRNDLVLAIVDLQEREGTSQDNIGFCEIAAGRLAHNAVSRHPKSCERIGAWAQAKGFEAVIWTALGRRFEEVLSIPFSPAAALSYLDGLSTPTREKALQYIHHAPPQTMTAFRRLLLAEETKSKKRQ
jgi:hypothetical protein